MIVFHRLKLHKKISRIAKRMLQYIMFSILLIFMLLGGWCVPPKLMEKVVDEIKAKYTVEEIIEADKS